MRQFVLLIASLILLIASLAAISAVAAPPKLNSLFPPGGQRGQTLTITASGEFPTWPVQIVCEPASITATAEAEKGKLRITIPAEATPGIVWLRAYNEEGAAAARPFIVGTLPEVDDTEPNDAPSKPQVVAEKTVVNGRLAKNGDVDGFAVSLQAGQTLVASLQAHSVLNSPMDAVLQICELVERRGQAEAYVLEQNHDTHSLDPQCTFTATRAGQYLVRLFAFPSEPGSGINFSGGENYVYRLTITTGGLIDHALPLAVPRDFSGDVKLFGVNLPAAGLPVAITLPSDSQATTVTAMHGEQAGAAVVAIVDLPSIVESGASTREQPQQINVPTVVSGQIGKAKETDSFAFMATKGAQLRLVCESRSLDFPLMAKIRVLDEAGKSLATAEATDQKRDVELQFTSPADGRYVLSLTDLHDRGGLRFAYRLTIAEPQPEFTLRLATDNFVLMGDQPLEVPVTIAAREGIAEPIEIQAVGLPAGVTCEVVKSSAKPAVGEVVKLVLKSSPEATAFSGPIRIVGTLGKLHATATLVSPPLAVPSPPVWLTVRK